MMINVDVSVKKSCMWKRLYLECCTRSANWKYLASIMGDSAVMCDEIIDAETKVNNEETKTIPTNFNEKNITCKI